MTRDDIIRMAREAGFRVGHIELYNIDPIPFIAPVSATDCLPELERFAALVAAAEREKRAKVCEEIVSLRAKVAEMERQEPVMWANSSNINSSRINKERGGRGDQHTCSETQTTYHDTQLYALPGAKPAPSVPEGWQLVPTAESRHPGIYKMLGALHAADNTPGMSEWESYRAMLSEAPEVKS